MVSGEKHTMKEKTFQIGVRLNSRDVVLLKRISKHRGEDLSDFVRRAIRSELARLGYLKPHEKKALGIQPKQGGD